MEKLNKVNLNNLYFTKKNKVMKLKKIIIVFLIVLLVYIYYKPKFELKIKDNKNIKNNIYYKLKHNLIINKDNPITNNETNSYNKNIQIHSFAILRKECSTCGLFSFYIYFLGCANKYINKGYIPIIDLKSYPNMYNNFSKTYNEKNPWEYFFEQPYGYTLEMVLKNETNITYFYCKGEDNRPNEVKIFYNKISIDYWHILATKFLPIKRELIIEANIIRKKLFGESKNILGVKIRGTDYLSVKPRYHPKPPSINQSITDVKEMDNKYKYDYIFFASEDEKIKERFIKEFKDKIKYFNSNIKINYNYDIKKFFTAQKDVIGNIEYAQNYIINIYILTKCIDIVMTRGSGGAGIIIFTKGFRHSLIYNLGEYS